MGKESICNAGSTGDAGSIPGLERSPGGSHGTLLQHSCLENPMDRGAWATGRATGGLQSKGLQRVRHNYVTYTHTHTHTQLLFPRGSHAIIAVLLVYYHFETLNPELAFQNVMTILTS